MSQESQRPVAQPDTAASAPQNMPRVLVVDDEPGLQMLSQLQLQKLGCDVTVASSGEEALARFASAKQENLASPYALVLMDLVMQGLDGLETSREILLLYPGQKITIVSGYAPDPQIKAANQIGIGWLVKPYAIAELAKLVQTVAQT